MRFPADKKAVREGDVLGLVGARATTHGTLLPRDVPFVGHTGLLVIERQGSDDVDAWYRDQWSTQVVSVSGVHGVAHFSSRTREGLSLDLVYLEGDAAEIAGTIRTTVAHHGDATILVDAPFDRIEPLRYPFIEALQSSSLPKTVQ